MEYLEKKKFFGISDYLVHEYKNLFGPTNQLLEYCQVKWIFIYGQMI